MTENFEFDDVKKVRKSLIIISVIGILLKNLIKYSIGSNIEFLGFKIPADNASFLSNFVGIAIIFYIVILLIRFSSEQFPKYYKKKIDAFDVVKLYNFPNKLYSEGKEKFDKKIKFFDVILKKATIFLDIIFPILLGIISLFIIF